MGKEELTYRPHSVNWILWPVGQIVIGFIRCRNPTKYDKDPRRKEYLFL